jgi:hypothetical protein
VEAFRQVRAVGTPLLAITTADQQALQETLRQYLEKNPRTQDVAVVRWDTSLGLAALGAEGENQRIVSDQALATALSGQKGSDLWKAADALMFMARLPERCVVFFHNAQEFITDPAAAQGVSNLRDAFKKRGCTFVMLCPYIVLPPQLQYDVVVMEEDLPLDVRGPRDA